MQPFERDFIIIVGNQGQGKSVWSKYYCESQNRLLVFDPLASYKADFDTDPSEWVTKIIKGELKQFRFGRYDRDDLQMLGDAAYAAGPCTFVIEECALIFKRGEELHEWAKPLVFTGRPQPGGSGGVNLVLIAQRAAKIPLDIRSQASRIVSFSQSEPVDVKALVDRIGENAEEIPMLPKLTCIDWKNDGSVSRYSVKPA